MIIGSLVVAAFALLVVFFASPLFAVLGFEYSALMALVLSLVCGLVAIQRSNGKLGTIGSALLDSFKLSLIPFVISSISLLFLPNCAFRDGILFYVEIAIPSAVFGTLFGLSSAWLIKRKRSALFLFLAFWCVSLFLSFLPGYYNPQLYTYGWQYGFFPGIVWDESLELTNAYLAFRLENVLWIVFALSLAYEMRLPRRPKMWFVIPGVISLALFGFNDWIHITTSHQSLEAALTKTFQPDSTCTVYYASLTEDEKVKISRDVRWYLHDIEGRFNLSELHPPIAIYIYPSSDRMFDLIGTRSASLAKPWLGEVHIAKENLESLKHELTHVLLREKGVFPFYASWSTGVTEGAAMSVEPEYDGIYTIDEHAARILQLHYATGVRDIMSFTGFASNASEKSYVLAGSFSRYLLKTYGPGPYDRVYSSLDWKKEYGKPLETLEVEWKRWLTPLMAPMDGSDSAHFQYYYNRSSIIYQPCLRRIGKLERQGSEALRKQNFSEALRYYHNAIEEGAGISALFDEETTLLRMNNWHAALAVLDTTSTPAIRKQSAALDLQRADLHVLANDTSLAASFYSDAESIKLNWQRFPFSYGGSVLLHADPDSLWKNYLTNAFTNPNWNHTLNEEWLRSMSRIYSFNDFRSQLAIKIFRLDNFIRSGSLAGIHDSDLSIPSTALSIRSIPGLTSNDSLALSIYLRIRSEYCFGPTGEELCPEKYRRTAEEMSDEIKEEWQFLQSDRSALARGTNPK